MHVALEQLPLGLVFAAEIDAVDQAVAIRIFGLPGHRDLLRGGARQRLRGRAGGGRVWRPPVSRHGDAVGRRRRSGGRPGGLRGRHGLGDHVDALHHRRRVLRQVGQRDAVEQRGGAAGARHLRLPLDVARVGAGDARAGGVGQRLGPIAPGAVGLGRVAGARAEDAASSRRAARRASSGCPSARPCRHRAPALRKSRSRRALRPGGRCGPCCRWRPARNGRTAAGAWSRLRWSAATRVTRRSGARP